MGRIVQASEIDQMPAGRELDALVEKEVMKHNRQAAIHEMDKIVLVHSTIGVPPYSTDIAAAWQVAIKLKETHRVCLTLEDFQFDGKYWQAVFKGKFNKDEGKWTKLDYAWAETPELAICRAALKVIKK